MDALNPTPPLTLEDTAPGLMDGLRKLIGEYGMLGLRKVLDSMAGHDLMTAPKRPIEDEKYVVFKREAFYQMMGYLALPPWRDMHTGVMVGGDIDAAPFAADVQK